MNSFHFFALKKDLLPVIVVVLLLIFSSCKPNRHACSYAVRNKVIERIPGIIDTISVQEIDHYYDKDNRSYLEIGKFYYRNESKIIIASDLYNDPVRFNVFVGFTRGFSIYDKYEKVNYLVMDSVMVDQLVQFNNEIDEPRSIYNEELEVEYTLTENVYISFLLEYTSDDAIIYSSTKERKKILPSVVMDIWMNGRKHRVNYEDFFKAITSK